MNFVFFSPHFPANGADFCDRLKKAGATVLGIGDVAFEALDAKLKSALSEYYRVADMENYDLVFRAMGHFIHKWGRIDRFESLNEHWLELEANIRTDFNIYGTKLDFVKNLKRKSRMRAFFRKSGVETIAQRKCSDRAGAMTFIRRVGYPVVIKPDSGSGASNTFKISNARELDQFFRDKPEDVTFVMEQFIEGLVVTYDGLVNRDVVVVLAASHRYDQSVMEVVNRDRHMSYTCFPTISPAVEASDRLGRNWPPPAMIVPCRRMTGMTATLDHHDFGSRRLKRRFTGGSSPDQGIPRRGREAPRNTETRPIQTDRARNLL